MNHILYSDKTIRLFSRYLNKVGVNVSLFTIKRLFDSPLGASVNGLSEMLDVLQVDHRVYRLPLTSLEELEAPFWAQLNSGEYVIVEKLNSTTVTSISPGHVHQMDTDHFRQEWNGVVLVAQPTENTVYESYVRYKDLAYLLFSYRTPVAILIVLSLLFLITKPSFSFVFLLHLFLLGIGMGLAVQAIRRERGDSGGWNRFCRIGQRIDCQRVLRSGVTFPETHFSLGEIAWFGFTTLLVFACISPQVYKGFSVGLLCIAFCFTVYSVIYQVFVIRIGCLICMGINLVVWSDLTLLLWQKGVDFSFSFLAFYQLGGVAILILGVMVLRHNEYRRMSEENRMKQRLAGLLDSSLFLRFLSVHPKQELPDLSCTIHYVNPHTPTRMLFVVLSPRCRYCMEVSKELRRLSGRFSLQILFLTSSKDSEGEEWVQKIIAVFLTSGWEPALEQIERWYRQPVSSLHVPLNEEAISMWARQQEYCRRVRLNQTPLITVNGYRLPDCYEFRDLYYIA